MKIHLIRHAETEWNLNRRLQGWGDAPLTEKGILQSRALGVKIGEMTFDRYYCSTSARARTTLSIAMNGRPYDCEYSDNLREIGLGDWEGRSQAEIEVAEPENFEAFWKTPREYHPHGGERYEDVIARTTREVERIVSNGGDNVLVMSHTIAIRCIILGMLGEEISTFWQRPYLNPTSVTLVEWDGAAFTLKYFGDSDHLDGI